MAKRLANPHPTVALAIFATLLALTIYMLLTSETIFDIPNIFKGAGISTQNMQINVFGFSVSGLALLTFLQFAAAFIISRKGKKHLNLFLLCLNVVLRLLFSLHLPTDLTDVFRNEVYGEHARATCPINRNIEEQAQLALRVEMGWLR